MSDAPSLAQTTRSSTPTEMAEQEAMVQCSETCDETGEDADMDLGEGTSNAASESDPAPSANKPEHKSAFVKIMELGEREMLTAYIEAFFDHYQYYEKSGGDLHGNISVDTIVYLEEPKKGGLLHFDPPIRMSEDSDPRPRQRLIPGLKYDENGEVIVEYPKEPEKKIDRRSSFERRRHRYKYGW